MLLATLILGFATAAQAYDGSGGLATRVLLGRVEFQEAFDPERSPARFPWDDARKAWFLGLLEDAIVRMPLDVAQIPNLRRIVVGNGPHACATPYIAEVTRQATTGERTWDASACGEHADWYPTLGELVMSGAFLEQIASVPDRLPLVFLHEFTHVWEQARPAASLELHRLRHRKASKAWDRVREAHGRWYDRRFASERPAEDLGRDYRLLKRLQDLHYSNLRLPRRGPALSDPDDPDADKYPMHPGEYLSCLAEAMWSDPDWARAQYAPSETAWANTYLFGGRLPGFGSARLELPRRYLPELLKTWERAAARLP